MNVLNMIPVIGWFIALVLCALVAIPVDWLWNSLAPQYFDFLPKKYLDIPYWHMTGLIWLIISLKGIFFPVPWVPDYNRK